MFTSASNHLIGEPHKRFPRLDETQLSLRRFVHSIWWLLSRFKTIWTHPATISGNSLQLSASNAI